MIPSHTAAAFTFTHTAAAFIAQPHTFTHLNLLFLLLPQRTISRSWTRCGETRTWSQSGVLSWRRSCSSGLGWVEVGSAGERGRAQGWVGVDDYYE